MTETSEIPVTTDEAINELVLEEVRVKNASCIKAFEILDKTATFFITAALVLASSTGSIMAFAFINDYYELCAAATMMFTIFWYILYLLIKIVEPTDKSHQGDTPQVIRSYIDNETTYRGMLREMESFYGKKISINEGSNIRKANILRKAIRLLIFSPYLFLLIYLVLKAPRLLSAFRDFLG